MAIDDRDYMRERLRQPPRSSQPTQSSVPPQPPRRNKRMPIIAIALAVVVIGSAAIWFMRDAGGLFSHSGPAEGSLRVNINTATLTELESIPGIGPALAKQIIAHRPYRSVDELIAISGIGAKSLESLRPFVKVDGKTEKLR